MPISHKTLSKNTCYGLIALALSQGYGLYFLSLASPTSNLPLFSALYALVIALPAFFYLSLKRFADKKNLFALLLLGLIFALTGWHLGKLYQASPYHNEAFILAYCLSMGLVLFLLSLMFCVWQNKPFDVYAYCFQLSWQFLAIGLVLAGFIGAFWLLLSLWAWLFKAINIGFFYDLFFSPAFAYPISWLVLGFSLVFIRQKSHLFAFAQPLYDRLWQALLPLSALITLLFLAILPISGLQAIWNTGYAATLMIALSLTLLFLYTIVASASSRPVFYRKMFYFIHGAVVLLPVLIALAAWALWLRIEQHGFSVSRLWAATIIVLSLLYSVALSLSLLRQRLAFSGPAGRLNQALAGVILLSLLLINTPLADFQRLSAQSQVQRLMTEQSSIDDFDYAYLRFSLSYYGIDALKHLQQSDFAQKQPELLARIDAALHQDRPWQHSTSSNNVAALISTQPAGDLLPPAIAKRLSKDLPFCTRADSQCKAYHVQDKSDDWLIFDKRYAYNGGGLYRLIHQQWHWVGHLRALCQGQQAAPKQLKRIDNAYFLLYQSDTCLYAVDPDRQFIEQQIISPKP